MPYVTKAEVREQAAQGTTTATLDDDRLDALIEQASRYFDIAAGVEPEYFEPVAEGYQSQALERVFYGDGTHYLRVDPFIEGTLSAADYPVDYTVPDYRAVGQYLVRSSSDGLLPARNVRYLDGWGEGVPVTVTAVWGYSATPADVKMAVIEMVLNLFRSTDPAEQNITDLERQPLRQALPPRAQRVADHYRLNRSPAFV